LISLYKKYIDLNSKYKLHIKGML